jgi:D-3-phosphoglycerate dehydrogenase
VEVAVEAVELLVNYLTTGAIRSAVNALSLDPQTLNQLRGYLDVAYRLGIFMSQWHGGSLQSCELNVEGEIGAKDTRLMLSAFCVGLIGDKIEGANIVNAEVPCRERGIEIVHKSTQEHGTFNSVVSAKVTGEGKSLEAGATLFGKSMPRLIKLGEYQTDAYMDGILLIFTHLDRPGVIGKVGKELADGNVNIAQMAVGREGAPGGPAVGVLNLDNAADDAALNRIIQHGGIDFAKQIFLPKLGVYPEWLA